MRHLWDSRRAIVFYALVLAAGWALGDLLRDVAMPEIRPMNEPAIHRIVTGALLAFVITAAIPFVPGAEIGFGLLLVFGAKAAPVVYVGMVSALLLSYMVGRLIPPACLVPGLHWLGLTRAAALAGAIGAAAPANRPQILAFNLPPRIARLCLGNRYVLLAALINLPGNSLLGGGGGLAFAAGLSRVYGTLPFTATVALAVAPLPLVFWLW